MHVVNGVTYAGERAPSLRAVGVCPFEKYPLWVRFLFGEAKVFDFKRRLFTDVVGIFDAAVENTQRT